MPHTNPEEAENQFYLAFRNLDLAQMQSVWSPTNLVTCLHPGGGLLQGIDAVLASWKEIFRDSAAPDIEHRLLNASIDRHLAVHTVEERIQTASSGRRARVIATNVYQVTDGGWLMLAHHASLPLVRQTAEFENAPALH